ncbi:MAG: polyprenol monophosphomannose synthase [Candidatus Kapaibacterium sp.]|jgi:dolichol-phosphate mannosyltransferase
MKTIVVIPTYNEIENIDAMIDAIHRHVSEMHILIVDDGSPDGTAQAVQKRMQTDARVHLLQRAKKSGLGTAYCAGFTQALSMGFEIICQMDADFSHNPEVLVSFLNELETSDVVIGSRYYTGVNVVNWPMSRLLLSYTANLYTRIVTRMPIKDATGGFKGFRASVLQQIDLTKIRSNGYAFQIEMNYRAWRLGARMREISIIFIDRVNGVSKMSKNIIFEAAWLVWKLRLGTLFGR